MKTAALRRSGRPYTDDELLMLMTWLAWLELGQRWLAEALAGTAALVVEGEQVRRVENAE